MRKLLVASLLAASASTLPAALAPPSGGQRPPGSAAGTLTRSASKYHDLENRVLQGLHDKSPDALDQLLAPDFEVWSAERSGPVSRQAWQQAGFAVGDQPARIRDITVREFGEMAVVSFLLERSPGGSALNSTVFIVDVWNAGANVLNVRYVSSPGRPAPKRRSKI